MKNNTKILLTVLITMGILILLYMTTTHSNTESETPNESINTSLPTLTVISNEDLAGTSTMKQFDMPDGYGYVKVKFKSTGSKPFTFTINLGSAAGTMKLSGTVLADGKEHTFFNDKVWSTGDYFVNISSSQGMSGTLSIDLGADINKIKSL